MYTALYRAKRPEVFSEVLGQEHIVKILKHQIETDTVSHAYLFCGTRGTGKTTTARILAKAVNCLDDGDRPCGQCDNCKAIKEGTFMDVIEIDAASNNGVDNIRELRESVKYPPAVGRKKVYIIDEVHMLSTGASNALLKTLEEPPDNVLFILATTDPQKLPQTILSRCMRLDFKRVPENVMVDRMIEICAEKGVEITDSAVRLVATNADGSMRDGLSLLDQCMSGGDKKLDRDLVLDFLGTVSEDFFIELTDKVLLHNVAESLILLDEALQEGKDVKQLMKDWMAHYRSLLITKFIRNPEDMLNLSSENVAKLREQSNQISIDEINNGIITLARTINDARYSTQSRILFEMAIVTIASGVPEEGRPTVRTIPATAAPVMASKPMSAPRQAGSSEGKQGEGIKQNIENGPTENMSEDSLETLWSEIFEDGETVLPSFNIIRMNTVLTQHSENQFVVLAGNEITKDHVEENGRLICELMEARLGRKIQLTCKLETSDESEEKEERAKKIAEEAGNKFNLNVEIK